MSTPTTLISVEEYLNTSYEPDRDFVDGVLLERNVGTPGHGRLQFIVARFFEQYRSSHLLYAFLEVRLLVNPTTGRHRIPDVMVLQGPYRKGKAITDVPVIVVEIKSPDDTLDDIIDRCFDYEHLQVRHILVMDPDHKRAWAFHQGSLQLLVGDSVNLDLARTSIHFPFTQLFAELDDE